MGQHFPECYAQLLAAMEQLENHYHDMCDIEFTIEQGRLFLLQTRVGKRTAAAAIRMAVEMAGEGLIDEREAVLRVQPSQLDQLLHPNFDPAARYEVLATGLKASPGAAVGKVYFTADDAQAHHEAGEKVLLVRPETSPDDLHGMIAAQGILTSRGGLVSHAAVVARGMGTPAICGADAVRIDVGQRLFTVERPRTEEAGGGTETVTVREGDLLTINGSTGEIVVGEVAVVVPEPTGTFGTLLGWADRYRRLKVRTNADLPEDALKAREFGAEGIGLCRTEHMFLGDRLPTVQRMILADTAAEEVAALEDLHALQRQDFVELLDAMDGLPVTVRLLDPPLHEFLPDVEELLVKEAKSGLDATESRLLAAAEAWREVNPMLGTRGCRLGILKPGLYRMQVRALVEAAIERKLQGGDPRIEIMIPLVVSKAELALLVDWTREVAEATSADEIGGVDYLVGTMIETPRAALTADAIAEVAEFFSFGTNDLTQMAFGFSRDDVEGRFMPQYLELGLLPANPFDTLDSAGRRPPRALGGREGPLEPARHQARHLRRARRRSRVGAVLPRGRARLRVVLPVPGADRPVGGRARRARGRRPGVHRLSAPVLDAEEISAFLTEVFPGAMDHFAIEAVGDMTARVRMLFHEARLRPGGTISGPSLMTLADTGVWVALLGQIGRVALSVTSHLDIDFLRKPDPGDVLGDVRLLKVGRRLAVGTVTMSSEGDPRPVAHASVTYAIPSSHRPT